MWTSRRSWITTVSQWASTPAGVEARRGYKLGLIRFITTISVIALYADGRTGRNVAVTNSRIAERAKVSERLVTNVRAVLAGAGWAVEYRRGYGGGDGLRNRPSVWHLTSRRRPGCDLPSSSNLLATSPVQKHSPNARTRGEKRKQTTRATQHRREQPRPLHVQKLAAYLQANCVGMDSSRTHAGTWCAALEASHLQLDLWTGKALITAMNASMRERNWHWPDAIANPMGFLRFRLAQLPAAPEESARPVSPGPATTAEEDRRAPASKERVVQYMAQIRATLARGRS